MTDWPMRHFRLSPPGGRGVSCETDGASVGPVPLLQRAADLSGREAWAPRSTTALNADLGFCYGLPVDVASRAGGLAAIARALNGGAILRAKIAALHLQFPDLPPLTRSYEETAALAKALHQSGILKADWDPAKHPRLGGPPNAGWFTPAGSQPDTSLDPTPIADFSGGFHDVVVDLWVKYLNENGIPAIKAPAIRIIGPNNAVIGYPDIIMHWPGLPIEVIEVKTGSNPPLTPNQMAYLPALQIGGHIYSNDPRIQALGLQPGVPFPPMVVYVLFANPGEENELIELPPPVIIPAPRSGP